MGITGLGHIGLHVSDLQRARDFYTRVLGLQVTHEETNRGMIFLSAQPDVEDHEVLLVGGRAAGGDTRLLQQLSFHVKSLADLKGYLVRFKEEGVDIDRIVTHGVSVSIYFYDPDRNRLEVYYRTGIPCPQPFSRTIELEQPDDAIMADVRANLPEAVGATS